MAAAVGSAGAQAAVPTTWCGLSGPQSPTDRKPDLIAGNQVTVLYAHPSDLPDRISLLGNPIATDVASADAWWRGQDAARTLRFDLFGFPNCSGMARLDIADVALPHDSAYYRPLGSSGRYTRLFNDLVNPPFAFDSEYKKYVVYFDGPSDSDSVCGQAGGDFSHGPDFAFVYVQSCGLLGRDGLRAHVAVHELIHALGAVQPGAPNECPPPDNGHVCDNPLDILYPVASVQTTTLDTDILDFNHNDYYGTNGAEDIRKSAWMTFLDAQVKSDLAISGTGTGSVISDVPGIQCPGVCSNDWNLGTEVILTATAAEHSRFVGWTGGCPKTDVPCDLVLNGSVAVGAVFALQVPITLTVDASRASGSVVSTPAGISCPGTCSANFDKGQSVTLSARPGTGSRLDAWGGACAGRGACTLTADQAKSVTATFGRALRRLATSVRGKGKIVSAPAGISCPSRCVGQFPAETNVSLRVVPAKGYKLSGWSGACKGHARCVVKLNEDATVRATFKRR